MTKINKSPANWLGLFLWISLAGSLSIQAQTFGGATLRGTVTDPSKALVTGATVTVRNESTGDERTIKTNSDGQYYFTALNPAVYGLTVSLPGFKTYEQDHIDLPPNGDRDVDVPLQMGSTSESVVVSGSSSEMVETESGAKDYTINSKQIDNLSLVGRSALELLRILPGVVAPSDTSFQTVSMQGGARSDDFNVNGSRGSTNIVRVDGSNYTHMGDVGSALLTLDVDMVQEVKVLAGNYSAEYGTSGVQIIAATKGGSNEFHGALYDYIQNPAMNANDRSNNYYGVPRPNNKYQYIGGNIGGPVLLPFTRFNRNRNKLFFFFGAEIQRQDLDNGTVLGVVPTLPQRQGDFSQFLTAPSGYLNQPQIAYIPGTTTPAPNNNLQPYMTPLGTGLLNLYPKPNYNDPTGRYNYAADIVSPLNRDMEVLRVDYNASESTRVFLRLARDSENSGLPYGTWGPDSTFPLPGNIVQTGLGKSAALNMTSIISPTLTNEVLVSATSNILDNQYQDPSAVTLSAVNGQNFYGMFPRVSNYAPIAVFSGAYPGGQFYQDENMPLRSPSDSYIVSDDLSKFSGTHALKFGFYYERFLLFDNDTSCVEGCFDLNATSTPGTTGFDYGDLLAGRMSDFRQGTRVPYNNWKENNYEAYAQDSWKFRPNLTLEYGLRMAYVPAPTNAGLTTVFDPSIYNRAQGLLINGNPQQPNGFLLNSTGQVSAAGVNNPPVAWTPRGGFAWDITGKGNTVIRGGAGLFYNRAQKNFIGESVTKGPPNLYQAEINAFTGAGLGGGQGLTFDTLHLVNPYALIGAISVGVQTPNSYKTPHITNASLSISQRLPGNQVLEVSYVGSFARHLPEHVPTDVIPLGTLLSGTVGNADLSNPVERVGLSSTALAGFTPFPAYSSVNNGEYIGTSNYHSLQATLRRQLSSRLQYLLTYTFSKALGTGSGSDYDTLNPFNIRGDNYGLLNFDRTHIINASFNYSVPDLAQGKFRNAFMRGLLNGWQTSGIITLASSAPIVLNLSGAIANQGIAQAYFGTNGFAANAPDYQTNPQLGGTGEGQRILNLNALAIPGYGSLGPYQPPFYLRGPFQSNFDVTFFKNFQISERKKLQFRAGFFNLFNQAFPNSGGDINTTLQTSCNVVRNNVPNGSGSTSNGVCDPTGGFSWTPSTIQNFGTIVDKHGHRIVELVLKFYF